MKIVRTFTLSLALCTVPIFAGTYFYMTSRGLTHGGVKIAAPCSPQSNSGNASVSNPKSGKPAATGKGNR